MADEAQVTGSDPAPGIDTALQGATVFKLAGNAKFKEKDWKEALGCYDDALANLEDWGKPGKVKEYEPREAEAAELRAVLEANSAQCYLQQELFQRALQAAVRGREANPANGKAWYREALALEKLKRYGDAVTALQPLQKQVQQGGGSGLPIQAAELDSWLQRLTRAASQADDDLPDRMEDAAAGQLKGLRLSFDEICDKYGLRKEPYADELADLLTCGDPNKCTPEYIAERYSMDLLDAETFVEWIFKSVRMREELNVRDAASAIGM